jgi:hypothetical protein
MRKTSLLLVLAIPPCLACREGHSWRQAFRDYARPDTVERLHVALDGERARGDTARRLSKDLAAKNEYLLAQLNALSSIVNEIDRDLGGSRMGNVQPLLPNGELGDSAGERVLLEAKRARIAANLGRLMAKLQTSDSLWRAAMASDSTSRTALASQGETLAMFKTLAESRAVQFAEFEQRIDSLRVENRALADERDRMRDSLTRLASRMGRVYYVVGTREELLASGVVREVTTSRKSWKGWQHERQLLPSRESELSKLATIRSAFGSIATDDGEGAEVEQQGATRLPENGEFRELDRYRDTVLALPSLRRGHLRVISTQDVRFADGVDRDGRVGGSRNRLHISDPDAFWAGGRYLVLVIER